MVVTLSNGPLNCTLRLSNGRTVNSMNPTTPTPLSQLSKDEREERHADYLDKRSCQIASCLIRKGRTPEWAYRVGSRFAEIEFNRLIRWE